MKKCFFYYVSFNKYNEKIVFYSFIYACLCIYMHKRMQNMLITKNLIFKSQLICKKYHVFGIRFPEVCLKK